ncbi:MAG: diaminopimelate epimerase [Gammaproteobacteria bacterium]|nr:diaminopimelate epimerase [Gammaproteobacteria bacterium]
MLKFTKMHGLGNDFVVIDAINQHFDPQPDIIRRIADRHFGVGCDQLLLVESSDLTEADFRYRIFNANGGEVEQCGNGARCFARFVQAQGLSKKKQIPVETQSGLIVLHLEENGDVTVDMGVPNFDPASLPFQRPQTRDQYELKVDGQSMVIGAVSMGNPHAVMQVEAIEDAPVQSLGNLVTHHSDFPKQVNTGFMQVINRQHLRVRVHERGVGETIACGTGACAAMVIARHWNLVDEKIVVSLGGGDLTIQWAGGGQSVFMTGPATTVFQGELTESF